jgi:DNA repair photolyase
VRNDGTFHVFVTLGLTRDMNCITMYVHADVLLLAWVSLMLRDTHVSPTLRSNIKRTIYNDIPLRKKEVDMKIGHSRKTYDLIEDPVPHILVDSHKELHGWWPGKRECTGERMLINPFNGCSVDCFFCYAKALPGYFQMFQQKGVVTVCRNFDRIVAKQLDSIDVASCGYLSPVTDPFQPVNERYRLSEKIMEEFVKRNIPVEFITKERVSDDIIAMLRAQSHSFGQFSILTLNEKLRRQLMQNGATTDDVFESISRMASSSLHAVCRVDPIIPYITDNFRDLEDLILRAVDSGAHHIVTSVMDIPLSMAAEVYKKLSVFGHGIVFDMKKLYSQRIDNGLHADINYRKRLFEHLRTLCDRLSITFALCMEYDCVDGNPLGLNREFMSSTNCEGIDIPVYVRHGDRFEPAADCTGACLSCTDPICGIDDLALGRIDWQKPGFKLSDYRRWSRERLRIGQEQLFPQV